VVAATVAQAPVVTMPNLAGLTQAEAVRVLEQLGLGVGSVSIIGAGQGVR
jgi:beta-lactam-binding protein with PASTA domain